MKWLSFFSIVLFSTASQAQRTSNMNNHEILCDSISMLLLKSEIINKYTWNDSTQIESNSTNNYDKAGNLIKQIIFKPTTKTGSVMIKKFDEKNRMTEESWYTYPDTPVTKSFYVFIFVVLLTTFPIQKC